jgi:ureidoacrylate peracid hydrolase
LPFAAYRTMTHRFDEDQSMAETPIDRATRTAHVRPLSGLADKVQPEHTAVLVVDMQNEFCSLEGHIAKSGKDISAAQALAERLPDFVADARRAGALVVFVRNIYSTERNLYLSDVWLEHAARRRAGGGTLTPTCGEGSWAADFYGPVQPQPGDAIVNKHRYSAFHNTDLETILRANGIRTIVLTGTVTNVCVETTAREGYVRDYYVVLADDGCAAYSQADHDATLSNVDRFFGEVSTMAAVRAVWDEAIGRRRGGSAAAAE